MSYKIDEIEGIGPAYRAKLAEAGIRSTSELLESCSHAKGRKDVSSRVGLSEKLLLEWSNMADLMRVNGIGPQTAELLEAAGVDTIKELRNRNALNLAIRIRQVNASKKLTKSTPSTSRLESWISEAKSIAPKISH